MSHDLAPLYLTTLGVAKLAICHGFVWLRWLVAIRTRSGTRRRRALRCATAIQIGSHLEPLPPRLLFLLRWVTLYINQLAMDSRRVAAKSLHLQFDHGMALHAVGKTLTERFLQFLIGR
jgi:hypothetical protein